jgi:hypothetical protein
VGCWLGQETGQSGAVGCWLGQETGQSDAVGCWLGQETGQSDQSMAVLAWRARSFSMPAM